jgi:hypothetical protein
MYFSCPVCECNSHVRSATAQRQLYPTPLLKHRWQKVHIVYVYPHSQRTASLTLEANKAVFCFIYFFCRAVFVNIPRQLHYKKSALMTLVKWLEKYLRELNENLLTSNSVLSGHISNSSIFIVKCFFFVKSWSYPHKRPWRPVGLWDIKDSTLARPALANLIHLEGQI